MANRFDWLVITLLTAAAGAAHAAEGCKIPSGTVPFEFKAGQSTLRGFIDRPASAGKHPAIVILHGSGSTDVTGGDGGYNSSYDELRGAFRRSGFATVIWDKAGNGCSEGRYAIGTPLVQLTEETVAGIDALESRDDIDPKGIGLWAISLGGWVAPMVAVRRPEVAFLIIVSGPARDALAENEYYALNRLRDSGVGAAEAQRAVNTLRRAYAIVQAGGSRREFLAAVEPLERYPFFASEMQITETPEMKASAKGDVLYRTNQQARDYTLRADTYLRELHQPTLAIFGDQDVQVDWRTSVRTYRESFELAGNRRLTIKVFEGANHNLYQGSTRRFVDGYIDLMAEWLRDKAR